MIISTKEAVNEFLAEDYLTTGLCPCCGVERAIWHIYNYASARNIMLCVVCGLEFPQAAIARVLYAGGDCPLCGPDCECQ